MRGRLAFELGAVYKFIDFVKFGEVAFLWGGLGSLAGVEIVGERLAEGKVEVGFGDDGVEEVSRVEEEGGVAVDEGAVGGEVAFFCALVGICISDYYIGVLNTNVHSGNFVVIDLYSGADIFIHG